MPSSLKARLEQAAQGNGRSLTAEIVYRLQTTLEMDDYQPRENIHSDEDAVVLVPRAAFEALVEEVRTIGAKLKERK